MMQQSSSIEWHSNRQCKSPPVSLLLMLFLFFLSVSLERGVSFSITSSSSFGTAHRKQKQQVKEEEEEEPNQGIIHWNNIRSFIQSNYDDDFWRRLTTMICENEKNEKMAIA